MLEAVTSGTKETQRKKIKKQVFSKKKTDDKLSHLVRQTSKAPEIPLFDTPEQ